MTQEMLKKFLLVRNSFESIFSDTNYTQTIYYSDFVARSAYEREAKVIDTIQKDILSIVNNEQPFDVFICYKETDKYGNRTVDSDLAQDIYDILQIEVLRYSFLVLL